MNLRNSIFAVGVCLAGMVAEAVLAGRNPGKIMRSLRQPAWALPMWAWYLFGFFYYAACFLGVYRVSSSVKGMRSLGLVLMVAVMAANASWNFIFFRRRNLALSFRFLLPYSALVLVLLGVLSGIDTTATAALGIYALYLPYAVGWTYRTWKLNEDEVGKA